MRSGRWGAALWLVAAGLWLGWTAGGGIVSSEAASSTSVQLPMPKPPVEQPAPPPPPPPVEKSETEKDAPKEKEKEKQDAPAPPLSAEELKKLAGTVSDRELKAVEKKLEESRQEQKALQEKADALAQEIASLQQEMITAAGAAQDTEEDLSGLEKQLQELSSREQRLKMELGSRDDQLREVLTALERQALRPPEAILVQPMPAEDAIRSAILLRSAVPQLHGMVGTLRGQLQELLDLRQKISLQRRDIAKTGAKLTKQQTKLASLLERKQALQKSTLEAHEVTAKRADDLARNASSMRELLERLEVERKRREEEERKKQIEEARRVAALLANKPAAPERPKPPAPENLASRDSAQTQTQTQTPPPLPPATSIPSSSPGFSSPAAPAEPESQTSEQPAELQQAAVPQSQHNASQKLRPFEQMRGAMPMPARGQIIARYGQSDGLGSAQKGIVLRTRPRAQVVAPADGVVAFAGSFRGYGQLLIMEHSGGYHTLLSGMNRIDATVGQRILAGEPVGVMDSSEDPNLYLELRQDGQPINPLPWLTARKG